MVQAMQADAMLDIVRQNRDNWEDFLERLTAKMPPRETELLREIFNDLKDELETKEKKAAERGAEIVPSKPPSGGGKTPGSGEPKKSEDEKKDDELRQPGHGRRGASDFEPDEIIHVPPSFPSANGETTSQYKSQCVVVIKGRLSFHVVSYILPRRRLASGELQTTPLPK
jgi:hypothetical protein